MLTIQGFMITFLAIAILSALLRTGLRAHYYRSLGVDDFLLLFALCALGATAGVAWTIKDLFYLQIYVGLEWQAPDPDFFERMLVFEQRVVVASALSWAAIYAVKFSFLLFFKKLVKKVRPLEVHWWVVFGVLLIGALTSIPMAVIICPHYEEDYMSYCSIASQIANEGIYLDITTTLDCVTDALCIFPSALPSFWERC